MPRFPFILPFLALAAYGCSDDGPTPPPPAPVAAFTVAGTLQAGQALAFDASGSTDPGGAGLSYTWDFADGAHGGTKQVAHLYAAAGAYPVQLTIRDAAGATATKTQTVTVAAGPAPTGTATISGELFLPGGLPLPSVTVDVVGGTGSAQGANDGTVTLAVPAGVPVVLRLTRPGYIERFVRVGALPAGNAEGFFRAALRPRYATVTVSATSGGVASGASGARLEIAAGSLVHADGSPAAGAVDVVMTPIDVTGEIDAFPGAFTGYTATGASTAIATLGVMEVRLSQGGQPLQLAPGQGATLDIPIFTGGASLGQSIPLWSLDESSGVWVQEGSGTVVASAGSPTGLALRGTVGHLSWWNVDIPFGPFDANVLCVTNATGPPVPLGVSCRVYAKQEGVAAPMYAAEELIGPNLRLPLPLFPGVSTRLYATTPDGLALGDVLVPAGAAGGSQNVDIVLFGPAGATAVAAGGDGVPPLLSYDGLVWTPRVSPFDDNGYARVYAVAWNGTSWVAGGQSLGGTTLATSPNGLTWTAATSEPGFNSVSGLAWNGSMWVAVGSGQLGPLFATSLDGQSWTAATTPGSAGGGHTVAWNGSYWLAGIQFLGMVRSTDGQNWVLQPSPFDDPGEVRAIAWNGTLWTAVGEGQNGPVIATSPDGVAWTEYTVALTVLRAVTWSGTTWMAGGMGGVASSPNGNVWTVVSIPGAEVFGITWTGTEWIGVGRDAAGSAVFNSPDGANWTSTNSFFADFGLAVAARP
jgi:PKD domain